MCYICVHITSCASSKIEMSLIEKTAFELVEKTFNRDKRTEREQFYLDLYDVITNLFDGASYSEFETFLEYLKIMSKLSSKLNNFTEGITLKGKYDGEFFNRNRELLDEIELKFSR